MRAELTGWRLAVGGGRTRPDRVGRSNRRPPTAHLVLGAAALLALPACEREARRFREVPPSANGYSVVVEDKDLQPGGRTPDPTVSSPYEHNAYAVSEGKRLYEAWNCVGCHSHGGGGMGPPLMDDEWIYGSDPENIVESIVEGRPNGMPSFRGRIPNQQLWKISD